VTVLGLVAETALLYSVYLIVHNLENFLRQAEIVSKNIEKFKNPKH